MQCLLAADLFHTQRLCFLISSPSLAPAPFMRAPPLWPSHLWKFPPNVLIWWGDTHSVHVSPRIQICRLIFASQSEILKDREEVEVVGLPQCSWARPAEHAAPSEELTWAPKNFWGRRSCCCRILRPAQVTKMLNGRLAFYPPHDFGV